MNEVGVRRASDDAQPLSGKDIRYRTDQHTIHRLYSNVLMWTYRQDITGLPVPTDNFLVVAGTYAVETGQEPMSCESRYEDNEGISHYLQQLTRL